MFRLPEAISNTTIHYFSAHDEQTEMGIVLSFFFPTSENIQLRVLGTRTIIKGAF